MYVPGQLTPNLTNPSYPQVRNENCFHALIPVVYGDRNRNCRDTGILSTNSDTGVH